VSQDTRSADRRSAPRRAAEATVPPRPCHALRTSTAGCHPLAETCTRLAVSASRLGKTVSALSYRASRYLRTDPRIARTVSDAA
jgi:hypothetical protein